MLNKLTKYVELKLRDEYNIHNLVPVFYMIKIYNILTRENIIFFK